MDLIYPKFYIFHPQLLFVVNARSNAFVYGGILSLFAVVSGIVGVAVRRRSPRAAMVSGAVASAAGVYLIAYLSMGALALLLGVIARSAGLGVAIDIGTSTIALLSLATFICALTSGNLLWADLSMARAWSDDLPDE
jgi:hypothetical protein